MLSKRLFESVRRKHATLRQEFKNIRQEFWELKNSPTIAVLDKFTDSLLAFFESLTLPPLAWLLKALYMALFRSQLETYITENPNVAKIPDTLLRWVYGIIAVSESFRVGWNYLGFMASISLVPLGLFLYVWVAYPEIPQEYGGGRPTIVQLAVSSEAIPQDGGDFSTLLALEVPENEAKTRTTIAMKLLFTTDNYWYLRLPQGSVVAIRSEEISAVIWRGRPARNEQLPAPIK
jgi:hypothetical protein